MGGSTVKVRVDGQLCQGHTLCAMSAPDLFVLRDEDGHAQVVSEDVPADQEGLAREAARSCPEQAIALFEEHPSTAAAGSRV
jgi:ferredoxin